MSLQRVGSRRGRSLSEALPSFAALNVGIPVSIAAGCTSTVASAKKSVIKESPTVAALRYAWLQKKAEMFKGKYTKPDAEGPDTSAITTGTRPPALRVLPG